MKILENIKRWIAGLTTLLLVIAFVPQQVVAEPSMAPTVLPLGGTYISQQSVTITPATGALSTFYTLDGSVPDNTKTAIGVGPILIGDSVAIGDEESITLRAVSYISESELGPETSEIYTIDRKAPVKSSLTIASNNTNPGWAKVPNIVSVVFTADESITVPTIMIAGQPTDINPKIDGAKTYTATYTMTKDDVPGQVPFSIDEYKDSVGNPGKFLDQTDASNKVIFDKEAPKISLSDPRNLKLAPETSLGLSENLVYVTEDNPDEAAVTNTVNVGTEWKLVAKRTGAVASYDVTFVATDLAGNVSDPKTVPVDLGEILKKAICVTNSAVVSLLGTSPTDAEWGDVYNDAGAKVEWSHNAGSVIKIAMSGDLNLSEIKNGYTLAYNANDFGIACSINQSNTLALEPSTSGVRTINVVNKKGPKPVTDFYLVTGNGFVDLHWTNPTDPDFAGVNIYRSTVSGVLGTQLGSRTSVSTISYEDNSVVNGITYYYTLIAMDTASPSNPSDPSIQLAATPMAPKLVMETTSFGNDSSSSLETIPNEIKGDDTNQNTEEENNSNNALPAVGIALLIILALVGLYLLYLQNPNWFAWLLFWKRKKKK